MSEYLIAQRKAGSAVQYAIQQGKLAKLPADGVMCVDCGYPAIQYDHRDYTKPLEVDPVCGPCNKKRGHALHPKHERVECPSCQTVTVTFHRKTNTYTCRRCGAHFSKRDN